MKEYKKKPDTIKGFLYTGKNKTQLKKEFNIIEEKGVIKVVTPLGNKIVKPNQYVYYLRIDINVEDKKEFEKKYEEAK